MDADDDRGEDPDTGSLESGSGTATRSPPGRNARGMLVPDDTSSEKRTVVADELIRRLRDYREQRRERRLDAAGESD